MAYLKSDDFIVVEATFLSIELCMSGEKFDYDGFFLFEVAWLAWLTFVIAGWQYILVVLHFWWPRWGSLSSLLAALELFICLLYVLEAIWIEHLSLLWICLQWDLVHWLRRESRVLSLECWWSLLLICSLTWSTFFWWWLFFTAFFIRWTFFLVLIFLRARRFLPIRRSLRLRLLRLWFHRLLRLRVFRWLRFSFTGWLRFCFTGWIRFCFTGWIWFCFTGWLRLCFFRWLWIDDCKFFDVSVRTCDSFLVLWFWHGGGWSLCFFSWRLLELLLSQFKRLITYLSYKLVNIFVTGLSWTWHVARTWDVTVINFNLALAFLPSLLEVCSRQIGFTLCIHQLLKVSRRSRWVRNVKSDLWGVEWLLWLLLD